MILQELCGLYERLVQDPELHDKIPERGWSLEKVAWALVIGEDGHVLGLQPLGGDKQRNKEMLVPEHAGRSGKFPAFGRRQDDRALSPALLRSHL